MSDNEVEDQSILNLRYVLVMEAAGPLDVLFVVVSLRMFVWHGGGEESECWKLVSHMGCLVEVQMISFLTQVEGDQIYQAQAGRHLDSILPITKVIGLSNTY